METCQLCRSSCCHKGRGKGRRAASMLNNCSLHVKEMWWTHGRLSLRELDLCSMHTFTAETPGFHVPISVWPASKQSQEQALSALVKARCVLDNFEPALKMLAGDQASPESIEPWTLQQVRTLVCVRGSPFVYSSCVWRALQAGLGIP